MGEIHKRTLCHTECKAIDVGGTWNCVYYGVVFRGTPCLAPKDFPCEYKSRTRKKTKKGSAVNESTQKLSEICPICGGLVKIRNPTGHCDHLYYPESLDPTKLLAILRNSSAAEAEVKRLEGIINDYSINLVTKNTRLTKAQELVKQSYDNQVKIVRLVCNNIAGEMLRGEKLQDTVIYHLDCFKRELEVALGVAGGEAEKK